MALNKLTKAVITASVLISAQAQAATELEWWHAMGGALGEKVNELADNFNNSQNDFVVKPVFKGSYAETMTSAIAAFRSRQQPHLLQVYEVGTATMMAADRAIYPVHELMEKNQENFDSSDYLPAVTGYYTTNDGDMLSMPFNSSTPVLYYNKDAFKKAGLDENKPPQTWKEMEEVSKKLLANGQECGFTTGYQGWVQMENFAAIHNLPFSTHNNGFESVKTEMQINQPEFVHHVSKMKEWSDSGVFKYGGRDSDSAPMFYSGECAMFMNSSASLAGIIANMPENEIGVAKLPYWDHLVEKPENSIIGGASLWVMQGHQGKDYEGVADFLAFLSEADIQADWHQFTGYLPITNEAYELTKEQGFYSANPGIDTAIEQMTRAEPVPNSKGLRLGNFVQIRDVMDQELEQVWAGTKTPDQALNDAVSRSNQLLRQFERTSS